MIQIFEGHVYHSRAEVAKNSFKYPIFYLFADVNKIELKKNDLRRLFLNIDSKDYLSGPEENLDLKIKSFILKHFSYQADEIQLLTIPRFLGYAFNPVSFWYCIKNQKLEAVLVEVNNTFSERHFYWLYNQGEDLMNQWLIANKEFHVSPFFKIEGLYKFRFINKDQKIHADIQFLNEDHTLKLQTWLSGQLNPLDLYSRFKLVFKYGWMTPLIVLRIHYQAIKLFLKKVKYFKKPIPPSKIITDGIAIKEITDGATVVRS